MIISWLLIILFHLTLHSFKQVLGVRDPDAVDGHPQSVHGHPQVPGELAGTLDRVQFRHGEFLDLKCSLRNTL